MNARRLILPLAAALVLGGAMTWAFWPEPVAVDLAAVTQGPMEVTVSAEGVTHIRERYDVAAPLAGTLERAPVEVGDAVVKGETVVGRVRPLEPAFLDARAQAQAEAAVEEARASLALAGAKLAEAQAVQSRAESDYSRATRLAGAGTISPQTLEQARSARDAALAAVDAARSSVELQQATLSRMQAQLLPPGAGAGSGGDCCVEIRAPASGTVLSLVNSSARPVQAGESLLSIGDLAGLEIVVDLLSQDAVKVAPGALAHVERWGGPGTIEAKLHQIEPSAFTKVSALGIEEQRVRLRFDLLTPPEARVGLGDAYRVFVRVVIWSEPAVLQVPIGALFRSGTGWAVFRAEAGRAVLTPVTLGRETETAAQILSGLSAGDRVVAFPGAQIADGLRIAERPGE